MIFDSKPYTLDRVIRIALTVGLVWGFVWLLGYLSDVLIPFAIALLLAYLINPLTVFIQKKIRNRGVAVFLSLFLVILVVALLFLIITPLIVSEISQTGSTLVKFLNDSELTEKAAKRLPADIWPHIKEFFEQKDVQDFFRTENFWKITEAVARKLLPGLWGVITGTTSLIMWMIGLAIIGLYLIFLLMDFQKVRKDWIEFIPPAYREQTKAFVEDFRTAMNRYFRAQALVAAIVGVLFAIGFTIIGLPLAILLGLFIGLLNMVPYLQTLGLVPALLLGLIHALETGGSFWVILGLIALVFVVVQTIQDVILVPRIMGKVTGLSPAMILLSLSIWGKLLGMFGLLIALPMTFLLWAYYQRFLALISNKKVIAET